MHQIADAIIRTRQNSLEKLLVNITAITGVEPPSLDMRYWLMGMWARAGRSAVRVAMVTRPEFMRADRIGVAVGLNQGFISNIFETEELALDWLLDRCSCGEPLHPPPA
ncbi:MAG: hypothetical protein ABI379_04330 [Rhodanobacter sp.]